MVNKNYKISSTEKMSLHRDENEEEIINMVDENENFIISELESEALVEESNKENSVSELVPELKALQLTPKSKRSDSEQSAGYVRGVISDSDTVVIGLAPGGQILDVGTAIFALTDDEPREIGVVSDIFGSVHEPMYSLQLRERAVGDTLKMDEEVFYLRGHPSTSYISVKREAANNNRYTIVRSTNAF